MLLSAFLSISCLALVSADDSSKPSFDLYEGVNAQDKVGVSFALFHKEL